MGRWPLLALLVLWLGVFAACLVRDDEPHGAAPTDPDRVEPGQPYEVGPGGASFSVGTTTISIPEGALTEQVAVVVEEDSRRPTGFIVDGAVIRFGPSGLHFAKPITVSFPAGTAGRHVYWTVDGDENRFEQLDTALENDRLVAHPSHFSLGFAGDTVGITCIARRRAIVSVTNGISTCEERVTTESDVHLWLVPQLPGGDREGALATDSPGILALYNTAAGMPIFRVTDATYTRYAGYDPANEYVLRSGNVVEAHVWAARTGNPPHGCENQPLIAVECSGTTIIAAPPAPQPVDAGADGGGLDAGSEGGVVDAGPDTDATTGSVACISKRRVITSVNNGLTTCTESVTTEPNVHFWLVRPSLSADPEGAVATDSSGILAYYNSSTGTPIFQATDATHTRYVGNDPAFQYLLRSGNQVEVHMNAARSGSPPLGCESVPLIHVECSGTTTLGK